MTPDAGQTGFFAISEYIYIYIYMCIYMCIYTQYVVF